MNDLIGKIQDEIRELRASDFHVCPADERDEHGEIIDDSRPCTCNNFDLVIDKLEELKQDA